MDSDDPSLRASSGAHSSRSQLIVVSPRPASETENEGENGAEEEVGITFSNPMLKDNGQYSYSARLVRVYRASAAARKMVEFVACLRSYANSHSN